MSTRRLILNAAEVRELAATGAVTVRRAVEHKSERPAEVWKHALQTDDGGWVFFDAEMDPSRDAAVLAVAREHKGHQCPLGKPGDLLWVAEKWTPILSRKPAGYLTDPKWKDRTAFYEADNDRPTWAYQWRSSTQMPRHHSRLTVRAVSVAVERNGDRWVWAVTCEQVPNATPAIPATTENAR